MQEIIVYIIIAAAVFFAVKRLVSKDKKCCGCDGCCGGCSENKGCKMKENEKG